MLKNILKCSLVFVFILIATTLFAQGNSHIAEVNILVYKSGEKNIQTDEQIGKRIDHILGQTTLEEKIEQITGNDFKSKANRRLGIPTFVMIDGPLGPRGKGSNTVFSAPINFAVAWDLDLTRRIGEAMGKETRILEFNLLLGPCINMSRVHYGGKNLECFGEYPDFEKQEISPESFNNLHK